MAPVSCARAACSPAATTRPLTRPPHPPPHPPPMQLHAKGKPIDRSDDDALLRYVADQAINYSGAELANLLNEAAILMVGLCACVHVGGWVCWGAWMCVLSWQTC